jgi:hypothetical protein
VPRAVNEENSSSAVDLAAMLNTLHGHDVRGVVDHIYNAIRADAHTIAITFTDIEWSSFV